MSNETKSKIRVWIANKDFYLAILANTIKDTSKIFVKYSVPSWDGEDKNDREENIEIPIEVFVSMFFTSKNYNPVIEINSNDLNDAFEFSNNPETTNTWRKLTNCRCFSVGDVVELITPYDSCNHLHKFYVCASYGFNRICRRLHCEVKLPVINLKK